MSDKKSNPSPTKKSLSSSSNIKKGDKNSNATLGSTTTNPTTSSGRPIPPGDHTTLNQFLINTIVSTGVPEVEARKYRVERGPSGGITFWNPMLGEGTAEQGFNRLGITTPETRAYHRQRQLRAMGLTEDMLAKDEGQGKEGDDGKSGDGKDGEGDGKKGGDGKEKEEVKGGNGKGKRH